MSVRARLLQALQQGPRTLPQALPEVNDAQRRVAAHTLRKEGVAVRHGACWINDRFAVVWALRELPPPPVRFALADPMED